MMVATASTNFEDLEQSQKNYLTINKWKVTEITNDSFESDIMTSIHDKNLKLKDISNLSEQADPIGRAGRVIYVAKDLVALGEDVYRLVIKGKPTNQNSYAPISVIPSSNGKAVDILDTDGWREPVKHTYKVVYENLYGIEVVAFCYSVIYSYGGSYNGKGAYLTAIQIVPESVRTLFGFDFKATMKLGGIQNQGSKEFPEAGATIVLDYSVSSVMTSQSFVDSFYVSGKGLFKKL